MKYSKAGIFFHQIHILWNKFNVLFIIYFYLEGDIESPFPLLVRVWALYNGLQERTVQRDILPID